MGQYGNQPDFGTRAVAITPKGFAGGSYVNVSYQDDEDVTQNIFLTDTNLNVSTYVDGSLIAKANNPAEWNTYAFDDNIGCWAYYNFDDNNAKYGKVYNRWAIQDPNLYSPGYSILDYNIAREMSSTYNPNNPNLGKQLKSIPTGVDGQDLTGTTLWDYSNDVATGTDNFGFTGLPGGYYDVGNEEWFDQWRLTRFWDSATEDGEYYRLEFDRIDVAIEQNNSYNGYYARLSVNIGDPNYIAPEPLNSAALYVGTGGDLVVTIVGSETPVMFKNVPDASFLPIIVSNVWERGDMGLTTASDIIAIY